MGSCVECHRSNESRTVRLVCFSVGTCWSVCIRVRVVEMFGLCGFGCVVLVFICVVRFLFCYHVCFVSRLRSVVLVHLFVCGPVSVVIFCVF